MNRFFKVGKGEGCDVNALDYKELTNKYEEAKRVYLMERNDWPAKPEVILATQEYVVLSHKGVVCLRDRFKNPCKPTQEELELFKMEFGVEYSAVECPIKRECCGEDSC